MINHFIFYTIIFFSLNLYSQEFAGVAYYGKKAEFHESSEKSSSPPQQRKNMIFNLKKDLAKLEYHLIFTRNESVFEKVESMQVNSDSGVGLANVMGDGSGIKYLNLKENLKLHQKEFAGKDFLIKQNLIDLDWEIIAESKTINGYKSYKAITHAVQAGSRKNKKVEIIAWFTPDIPIGAGPVGYQV